MLAISTAACSSLLLPYSRANVATSARRRGLDTPRMGVPGFVSWLETHSPEALVEMPALPRENSEITPREVDVVAFDLNSLVHNALRNARDEDDAIAMVFQMLHSALRQVRPRTTVVLALDGAAPIAKLETQRKRRATSSRRDERKKSKPDTRSKRRPAGVSALCATPGTIFMASLEGALTYWICAELQTYRARGLRFLLSGSDVPGEGELKIVDWLLSRGGAIRGEVALVGGDGDLVLQALTLQQVQRLLVVRELPTRKRPGVAVHVPTLRRQLTAARGIGVGVGGAEGEKHPPGGGAMLDDLEALACFTLMGNDYLPKLKEASFERLWRALCALRRHPSPYLAGRRLLRADRRFDAPLLAALLEVVLRIHQLASAAIAADVEAGVAQSAARAAHAMDGLAPAEVEATVDLVVAELLASWSLVGGEGDGNGHGHGGGDGVGGGDDGGDGGGGDVGGGGGGGGSGSAARYLGGVLWTVAMYTDGVAADYAYRFTNLNAPAASSLLAYLRAGHLAETAAASTAAAASDGSGGAAAPSSLLPCVPSSTAAPLPAPLVCSALLPLGELRKLAEPALVAELEEGGCLAFLTAAERERTAAAAATSVDGEEQQQQQEEGEGEATAPPNKLPPLDYPRTLKAAAALPEAVVGRSLRLSESPSWLDFNSTRANGRGRGRGRGGRGGRGDGRGGGRGKGAQAEGLPELPALPPDPPTGSRFRPLQAGEVSVGWLPASRTPRARRWADVP